MVNCEALVLRVDNLWRKRARLRAFKGLIGCLSTGTSDGTHRIFVDVYSFRGVDRYPSSSCIGTRGPTHLKQRVLHPFEQSVTLLRSQRYRFN